MPTDNGSTPSADTLSHRITTKAPRYKVIMHNDDYTTMEFVIEILQSIFRKDPAEATRLMLDIHNKGQAICGHYSYEIAETKICLAHDAAKQASFPLRCSMDRA